MWFNVVLILIACVVAFVGFTGYTLAKDNGNSAFNQLSKSEYVNKLEQLPLTVTPWDEPVSAMCYDTAAPLDREQYICPQCGEMTLYAGFNDVGIDFSRIPYYRFMIKQITKLDVKLDESQLCEKCSPNAKSRKPCLIVKYNKDAKPQKTCDFNQTDINILYEYSEGKKEHDNYNGKESLNNYKKRLEELLGTSIEDIK